MASAETLANALLRKKQPVASWGEYLARAMGLTQENFPNTSNRLAIDSKPMSDAWNEISSSFGASPTVNHGEALPTLADQMHRAGNISEGIGTILSRSAGIGSQGLKDLLQAAVYGRAGKQPMPEDVPLPSGAPTSTYDYRTQGLYRSPLSDPAPAPEVPSTVGTPNHLPETAFYRQADPASVGPTQGPYNPAVGDPYTHLRGPEPILGSPGGSGVGVNITSPFGERRSYESHPGIDLRTPIDRHGVGQNLAAVMSGVAHVRSSGGGGNVVTITPDDPRYQQYSISTDHLSRFNVKDGQHVEQGDIIGRSGGIQGAEGSGNSKGPHVHYEIDRLINGLKTPINPANVVFPWEKAPTPAFSPGQQPGASPTLSGSLDQYEIPEVDVPTAAAGAIPSPSALSALGSPSQGAMPAGASPGSLAGHTYGNRQWDEYTPSQYEATRPEVTTPLNQDLYRRLNLYRRLRAAALLRGR